MNNELILNEVHNVNNHSESTRKTYKRATDAYCEYFNMDLQELIMEAEEEENKGVRWKLRSLKRRLIDFRHFVLENYTYNTYKTWFNAILNIYKYYEIEIHDLPKINKKAVKKPKPINFRDLPDKAIIREAVNMSTPVFKAIILFMCSSGCARRETVNLTIRDYMDSLRDYSDKEDIFEIIEDIKDRDDVVPTWNVWRQKTNKYYTTYSSPESVSAINSYLLSRTDNFDEDSPLFKIHIDYLMQKFIIINNELGLGTVGDTGYNRFRSHMLRKFHASALYNDGMSRDNVNDLQGKAKNKTDEAYFMVNPDDLKYEYIKHLPAVTINTEVKKLSIKSPEFIKIEKEKEAYKEQLDELRGKVDFLMENYDKDEIEFS